MKEMDQDDMPALRLETANSTETLTESPRKVQTEGGTSASPVSTREMVSSGQTLSPFKEVEGASRDVPQPLSTTLALRNTSPTKSPKQRGDSSKLSVSSTTLETHEEGSSSKRLTRSQLRSQLLDQSFASTSESTEIVNENANTTAAHMEQESASGTKLRSRKGSASSADVSSVGAHQPQKRLRSGSSVSSEPDEIKKTHGREMRQRKVSTSSQDPVSKKDEHKLDKISEEGSASGSISEKSPRRSPIVQSRQKIASDASETALESYETSRRLTRHQRALLARSIELKSTPPRMNLSVKPLEQSMDDQDSDIEDTISRSSRRSSKRLQAKRQEEEGNDSPNSTASTVLNPALTPVRKRGRHLSGSEGKQSFTRFYMFIHLPVT